MKINTGIFIFDDVEILDFTGPYEVFSATRVISKVLSNKNVKEIYASDSPFNVFTITEKNRSVTTKGGLKVFGDYIFFDSPSIDILLIPGGTGIQNLLKNDPKWGPGGFLGRWGALPRGQEASGLIFDGFGGHLGIHFGTHLGRKIDKNR